MDVPAPAPRRAPRAGGPFAAIPNTVGMARHVQRALLAHHRAHGPVFELPLLGQRFTVLAGREANLFAIRRSAELFRSKEFWREMDAELGARTSLVSMDGAEHARYRKAQKPGFSKSRFLERVAPAQEIVDREIGGWAAGSSRPVTLSLQKIITRQLGVTVASLSPDGYVDDLIVYLRIALATRATKMLPRAAAWTPRYRRARARVGELAERVLAVHRTSPGGHGDLIDDVLAFQAAHPEILRPDDLLVAALGPFIAGLDTAASTGAFTLWEILAQPELHARIVAEIDEVFGDGVAPPAPEDLARLGLLHRTVLETLRLHPIAPGLTRTSTQAFEFAGFHVPAEEPIMIATTVPHLMEEHFPEPDRFDPERFGPDRREHRTPGVFAPYGVGPHTCLGAGFAEQLLLLTIATLLHRLELRLEPEGAPLRIDPIPTQSPAPSVRMRVLRRRYAA